MTKPNEKQLRQILIRNIRRLKKQGWSEKDIESYRRGWFQQPR